MPEPSEIRALQERIQLAIHAGDDDAPAAAPRSGTRCGRPGVNARMKRWVAARRSLEGRAATTSRAAQGEV